MVDPDANLIFGAVVDPSMQAEVSITLIATGFGDADTASSATISKFIAADGAGTAASIGSAASASSSQPPPAGGSYSGGGSAPVQIDRPPAVPQPRVRTDVTPGGIEIPAFLRKRRIMGK